MRAMQLTGFAVWETIHCFPHLEKKCENMPNKLNFRMKLNGYLNVPTGNHNNLLRHVNLHATIPTKLFAVFSEK